MTPSVFLTIKVFISPATKSYPSKPTLAHSSFEAMLGQEGCLAGGTGVLGLCVEHEYTIASCSGLASVVGCQVPDGGHGKWDSTL